MNHLTKDLTERDILVLRAEKENLERFLNSAEYRAVDALFKETYDDALTCILEADHSDVGGINRLLLAVGDARTAKQFRQRVPERIKELSELLLGTDETTTN